VRAAVLDVFEGRFQEAVAGAQRALRLAPVNTRVMRDAMVVFFMSRRYDEALAVARQGREAVPEAPIFPFVEVLATQLMGDADHAAELAARALAANGRPAAPRATPGQVLTEYWQHQMRQAPPGDRGAVPLALMMLGREEEALTALEQQMRDDPGWITWPYHLVSPVYEPVAGTPRFRRLYEVIYGPSS
jgi:tetratricopeptide (TPR) repeat protein